MYTFRWTHVSKRVYSWSLNENELGENFTPLQLDAFGGDCTMVEIAVFVCQGSQQLENDKQLPTWCSRHTRKRPKPGGGWRTSVAGDVVIGRGLRLQRPVLGSAFPGDDWEELNRPEIKRREELATASSSTGCLRWVYLGAAWSLEGSRSPGTITGNEVGDLSLKRLLQRRVWLGRGEAPLTEPTFV